jgi:aminoglycoside phosphotransferase (APT) family kinase protein
VPDVEVPIAELTARLAPIGARDLRRLAGGQSSLTYAALADGDRRVVVKVAPAGVPPVLNRDVLRQARVLRALAGSAVPVPEIVWEDAGEPPAVPPLFVMTFLPGDSVEPLFDADVPADGEGDGRASDVPMMAARLRAANDVMRALHALDPHSLGLGGEPVVTPLDELDRWVRLLQTVDAALVPGWAEVGDRLRSAAPQPHAPAIVHGDFRLGNLLADGARISAVIDWEIWTIGDPRVDVGWFLANADPHTYGRVTRYTGALPSPAELATDHGEIADGPWFEALACFKAAAVWALIVKHNRRRAVPDPDVEAMTATLPHLLDQARRRLPARPRP